MDVEMKVEFNVMCEDCREYLTAFVSSDASDVVMVYSCPQCKQKAFNSGYARGHKESETQNDN